MPENERPLGGRVALVTGGSRGIGRATVLAFAREGADVIIASRNLETCEGVAELVRAETGRRAMAIGVHVGHWSEISNLVETAYGEFGRIDVLVNNAGVSPLYTNATSISEELWHKVIDVNLTGPFRLTALVGERMAAGSGGSIINVSSIASRFPTADVIPYAAAKAGLNAITIAYAKALGPSVRVNAIITGPFLTDVSQAWDQDSFERASRAFALRRGGLPEEIVGTMLYLATNASSFTTGSLLTVDGGYVEPPPDTLR